MRKHLTLPCLIVLSVCAFASLAPDVVGKWTGRLVIEGQGAEMAKAKSQASSMKVVLQLKSNKTYTASQSIATSDKPRQSEGTWSLSGNKLTLSPKKRDGKVVSGPEATPRVYVLSSDGKTLTLDLTSQARTAARSMAQSKADKETEKAVKTMKVRIVLKKG